MKWLLLMILLAASALCRSQSEPDVQATLDRIAEELLATSEEDLNYEELYEQLTHLLANPVDINKVTREQLRAIMILSEKDINEFIAYRDTFGPFLDVVELQAIPGWTVATVARVVPFVRVVDGTSRISPETAKNIFQEKNAYLLARYERTLETRQAYRPESDSSQRYTGSPDKLYLRFRVSRAREFSLGFSAETDPGEPFTWNPSTHRYGFDFYSGHIQLQNRGRIENIIVGDFQTQFGQGLQLGSAFGLGKTAQTITGIRRSNLGFMPYLSAGEVQFMRGIGLSVRLNRSFRIHAFGSLKHQDAVVRENRVQSLLSSGLHRTAREQASRGNVTDQDAGAVIQFQKGRFDIGVIATGKRWSLPIVPEASPYNQAAFKGASYFNSGAYVHASWANVTAFAEVAQTLQRGQGVTAGILGNLTSKLEAAWLFRTFSRDFYATYANTVSEASSPQNEQGFYTGLRYSFHRRLSVSGYFDYFRFPWLRYRTYRPSDGNEWLIRMDLAPNRNTTFFIQYRSESKARNRGEETTLYETPQGLKQNFWIGGEFKAAETLSLKVRIQGSRYTLGTATTDGLAVVNEASWKRGRWSVALRYAIFDTDDYENRQYVYEKDVWLATSLPAYEGSGIRNYLLVQWALTRKVDLWLRWARTTYFDRELIGSGADEIRGNVRNDVKFQLRIKP